MADNNQKKQNPAPEQDTNSLRQIRIDKLHAMQEAGNDPFQVMTATQTAKSMEIKNNYEDFEDKEVSICGRMIARRIMGKASFAQIQDREGNIQIYVSRDDLGVDDYQAFKKAWDIGDILARSPFTPPARNFFPSPCCPCRRNSTASRTRTPGIVSAMSTSS